MLKVLSNIKSVLMSVVLLLMGSTWIQAASVIDSPEKNAPLNGPSWTLFSTYENAGFILSDSESVLESRNPQQAFVPASTTKLITALLAIQHWGLEHRFYTDFYLKPTQTDPILVVKGYGDPFLVSEELKLIAEKLKAKLSERGIKRLAGIQLDVSHYQAGLIMPGTSHSTNPYDAIPSALAANFNTINVMRKAGKLVSAEKQTPLLQIAKTFVVQSKQFKSLRSGKKLRMNLGTDPRFVQQYFANLLGYFISEQGVQLEQAVTWSRVRGDDQKLLRHYNSRDLSEVIKPMMKYSTNFIANQIALNLSVERQGGQASKQKVQQVFHQMLSKQFDWDSFFIEDGAGLSRENRLSSIQLIDVLDRFVDYKHLLPEIEQRVFAKSGSLIGVSTLAGYVQQDNQYWPFAIMINQKVPYRFRNKLAKELAAEFPLKAPLH